MPPHSWAALRERRTAATEGCSGSLGSSCGEWRRSNSSCERGASQLRVGSTVCVLGRFAGSERAGEPISGCRRWPESSLDGVASTWAVERREHVRGVSLGHVGGCSSRGRAPSRPRPHRCDVALQPGGVEREAAGSRSPRAVSRRDRPGAPAARAPRAHSALPARVHRRGRAGPPWARLSPRARTSRPEQISSRGAGASRRRPNSQPAAVDHGRPASGSSSTRATALVDAARARARQRAERRFAARSRRPWHGCRW